MFNSRRIIAFLTVLIFLCTNMSWAQIPSNWNSQAPLTVQKTLPQHLSAILVPSQIGKIQESFQGQGDKVVVLIQDAHAIPDAQRNIQKMIGHFQKEYGVNLVAVEGAASELEPQIFKSFPDKEILKKTFDEYMEKGEVTGSTAAAIFNDTPAIYHGIEDWSLYEEGLGLYLNAMEKERNVSERIALLQKEFQKRKELLYSKELLEIDKTLEDFRNNRSDLIHVLKKIARVKNPAPGTEIALFLHETRRDKENQAPVEMEVKETALALKGLLESKKDLISFNHRFQEFQISQITPEAFALFLKEVATKNNLPIRVSPKLAHLIKNHKRMRDIEGTKFFREFEHYAKSVKGSLFRNEEEKALDNENQKLGILGRLARLEMNREDWNALDGTIGKDPLLSDLKFHIEFYKNAEKRDEAFSRNLINLMKKEELNASLLVTGGFHTEGLTQRLKEKGISYVLVMPEIGSIPEHSPYREQMQGNVSWKDYFKVENGKVNLYKAFVRAARNRLLGEALSVKREAKKDQELATDASRNTLHSSLLLKAWRDQIVRDLARNEKITKVRDYTSFIDEVSKNKNDTPLPLWWIKVDKFIEGLRKLDTHRQFTEQNILRLFKPATMQPWAPANALVPGSDVTPKEGLIALASHEFRSELRNLDKVNEIKRALQGDTENAGENKLVEALQMLGDESNEVRQGVLDILRFYQQRNSHAVSAKHMKVILTMLVDDDRAIRESAIEAVSIYFMASPILSQANFKLLLEILNDENKEVRESAYSVLELVHAHAGRWRLFDDPKNAIHYLEWFSRSRHYMEEDPAADELRLKVMNLFFQHNSDSIFDALRSIRDESLNAFLLRILLDDENFSYGTLDHLFKFLDAQRNNPQAHQGLTREFFEKFANRYPGLFRYKKFIKIVKRVLTRPNKEFTPIDAIFAHVAGSIMIEKNEPDYEYDIFRGLPYFENTAEGEFSRRIVSSALYGILTDMDYIFWMLDNFEYSHNGRSDVESWRIIDSIIRNQISREGFDLEAFIKRLRPMWSGKILNIIWDEAPSFIIDHHEDMLTLEIIYRFYDSILQDDQIMNAIGKDPLFLAKLKLVERLKLEIGHLPSYEQAVFESELFTVLNEYELNLMAEKTLDKEERQKEYEELESFLSIVHTNLPLLIKSFRKIGLLSSQFRTLRVALPYNNPLTRVIRMLGEPSIIIAGYLDVVHRMIQRGSFDIFYSFMVNIARKKSRLAPQEIAGVLELLNKMNFDIWQEADWRRFFAQIERYHGEGFKVLNRELFTYFVNHENDKHVLREFKADIDRELKDIAWGNFNGLSRQFQEKYNMNSESELALVARYIPVSNLTAKDYVSKYESIKAKLMGRGTAWFDEIDPDLRRQYQLRGTEGYLKFELPEAMPEFLGERNQLHQRLATYTAVPKMGLQQWIDLLGTPEFDQITDLQKKQAIVQFIFDRENSDKSYFGLIPKQSDQELFNWLARWASFLMDTWKVDYAKAVREMIRQKVASLEREQKDDLLHKMKVDRFQFLKLNAFNRFLPTVAELTKIVFNSQAAEDVKLKALIDYFAKKFSNLSSDALRNREEIMRFIQAEVDRAILSLRNAAEDETLNEEAPLRNLLEKAMAQAYENVLERIGDQSDNDRKLYILADKIYTDVKQIFDRDIELLKKELPYYKSYERESEAMYRVGFFDDSLHLMSFMMTGVCTWCERDRQVTDRRYHFGKVALKDAEGRILGVSQIQLVKDGIQGFAETSSDKGWRVLAMPGINLYQGNIGMSSERAVLAILETAQRLAQGAAMQGAVIPTASGIHTNHPAVEGRIIHDLLQKGWLRQGRLTAPVILTEGTGGAPGYQYNQVYIVQIPEEEWTLKIPGAENKSVSPDEVAETLTAYEAESVILEEFVEVKRNGLTHELSGLTQEILESMPRGALNEARMMAEENRLRVKIKYEAQTSESVVTKSKNEVVLHLGQDIVYEDQKIEPVLFKIKIAELITAVLLPDYNAVKELAGKNENAYLKLEVIKGLLLYLSRYEFYHYWIGKNNWNRQSGNFLYLKSEEERDALLEKYRQSLRQAVESQTDISQWNVFLGVMDNADIGFLVNNYLEILLKSEKTTDGDISDLIKEIAQVSFDQRVSIASVREIFKEFILGKDVQLDIGGSRVPIEKFGQFDQTDTFRRIQEILVTTADQNEFYQNMNHVLSALLPEDKARRELARLFDENLFNAPERLNRIREVLKEIMIRYLGSNAVTAFEKQLTGTRGFENIPYLNYSQHDLNVGNDADQYGFLDYAANGDGADYNLVFREWTPAGDRQVDDDAGGLMDEDSGPQEQKDWIHQLFRPRSEVRAKEPSYESLSSEAIMRRIAEIYQGLIDKIPGSTTREHEAILLSSTLAQHGKEALTVIHEGLTNSAGTLKQFDQRVTGALSGVVYEIAWRNQGSENLGLLEEAYRLLQLFPSAGEPANSQIAFAFDAVKELRDQARKSRSEVRELVSRTSTELGTRQRARAEVPSALELREAARGVVDVLREVKTHLNRSEVRTIVVAGTKAFIPELQAAAEEIKAQEDMEQGTNALNHFRAIQSINQPTVIEYNISRAELQRMGSQANEIIGELLQAAHDAAAANKYVITRINLPDKIRGQLKLLDHNQKDAVRLQGMENTLILYNEELAAYERHVNAAPALTVTHFSDIQGPVLFSDQYADREEVRYEGPEGTKVAARIFTAALVWAAESLSERTFNGLIQMDGRTDGYRIKDRNTLDVLGAVISLMAQYRSELRIKVAA